MWAGLCAELITVMNTVMFKQLIWRTQSASTYRTCIAIGNGAQTNPAHDEDIVCLELGKESLGHVPVFVEWSSAQARLVTIYAGYYRVGRASNISENPAYIYSSGWESRESKEGKGQTDNMNIVRKMPAIRGQAPRVKNILGVEQALRCSILFFISSSFYLSSSKLFHTLTVALHVFPLVLSRNRCM